MAMHGYVNGSPPLKSCLPSLSFSIIPFLRFLFVRSIVLHLLRDCDSVNCVIMSSESTSVIRSKAELRYNTAALNLHKAIPKNTQTQVSKISYPTPQRQDTVTDRAKALERAIDGILRYRNDLKDKQKKSRIGETCKGSTLTGRLSL